jgi:4-diphosphocytidyl-2-C-methyl-D-erythritol kinase
MTSGMPSTGWEREFPAPAKLNLFLHVTGRRADGYHLLQSVFRLVDLCDSLRFEPRSDGQVRMARPLPGVASDDDLCVRAARALREAAGVRSGVDIHIDKRIPMGGGLGGGSSDAATVLLALNALWHAGQSPQSLSALGLRLGADVPFFLFGANAFVEGVGEVLVPVELPQAWYLILVPPVAVPTAAIFGDPELTRNSKTITISSFSEALGVNHGAANQGAGRALFGRNDLEPVACRKYPEVGQHLEWLKANCGTASGTARMSGSGACVFAEFATQAEADAVAGRLPAGMKGMVVRGLDVHPVAAVLQDLK